VDYGIDFDLADGKSRMICKFFYPEMNIFFVIFAEILPSSSLFGI